MGRQKLFEREDVIDKALRVFLQKGYLDTSLKDLEVATDVFKAGLYSEFGDKEGIFIECVKYYFEKHATQLLLLKEPYGWENIEAFLKTAIPSASRPNSFEANAFARDIPILPDSLKPIMNENCKKMRASIQMNLKAAGLKASEVEFKADNVFSHYCGLGVLANSLSKSELEKIFVSILKILKS